MQRIEIAHPGYLPTYDECSVCGQFYPRQPGEQPEE
jgi:hypothetical protein